MTVKDALHQLKLEISENENRKEFSYTEKMEWAKRLKNEYSKIARENQGKRNDLNISTNLDESLRTDESVAKDLDMSKTNYRKAEYIYHNADDDTIQKLNEEKISIHKAWTETKEKLESVQKEKRDLEKELKSRPTIEKEKIIETEVYPEDYHQVKNDLELLKHKLKEQENNNAKTKREKNIEV